MQGDLSALIERVENATGPDRELDHALLNEVSASGPFLRSHGYKRDGDGYVTETPPMSGANKCCGPQQYTSSLDAALALVEEQLPGTFWHVAKGRTGPDEPLFGAELVSPEHGGVNVAVEHESSVALALILALLYALSARDQQDGGGE